MEKNLEIRWHGRGGQGAKTAAQLLAESAMEQGKFVQAFPEYGPERAGAPMRAYNRIGDEPIREHCAVSDPQYVMVIDPTLLGPVNVTDGLGENGVLIVNTEMTPQEVRKRINFTRGRVFTIDATKIAKETIGRPLPNTPMLGAFAKISGAIKIDTVKSKIEHKFGKKLKESELQGNIEAVTRATEEVKGE